MKIDFFKKYGKLILWTFSLIFLFFGWTMGSFANNLPDSSSSSRNLSPFFNQESLPVLTSTARNSLNQKDEILQKYEGESMGNYLQKSPGSLKSSNFFEPGQKTEKIARVETLVNQVENIAVLDQESYDKKLEKLANKPIPVSASATPSKKKTKSKIKKASSVKATLAPVKAKPVVRALWPVKAVYPNAGALLPFKRIVAYYGNFYSKRMGVLGEYSETAMLNKLRQEIKNWEEADPETSVIPGIDYIAVSAQGYSGTEGLYRFRMPDSQIDKAIELAEKVNGIVILDIQPGLSSVFKEVKYFEKYLKTSKVHLALDPEFNMRKGIRPGKVIGSLDASEINQVAEYLADLVKENNLTPKVLIIHRFTNKMVTNYKLIKPLPEVQIVMDMDGWGFPAKKINTHRQVIYSEPVQFTGFKLFYKNDRRTPNSRMMTPLEVLKLRPQPSFIQYQ